MPPLDQGPFYPGAFPTIPQVQPFPSHLTFFLRPVAAAATDAQFPIFTTNTMSVMTGSPAPATPTILLLHDLGTTRLSHLHRTPLRDTNDNHLVSVSTSNRPSLGPSSRAPSRGPASRRYPMGHGYFSLTAAPKARGIFRIGASRAF